MHCFNIKYNQITNILTQSLKIINILKRMQVKMEFSNKTKLQTYIIYIQTNC